MIEEDITKIFAMQAAVTKWKNGQLPMATMNDDEILACFRSVFGARMIRGIKTEPLPPEIAAQEKRRQELLAKMKADKLQQSTLSTLFS